MPLVGHCNCGAITVTIQDQGLDGANPDYCHCTNCRRQSGATGTYILLVDDSDFKVEGTPKDYLDKHTDSGTPMHRYFCGDCGSPVMSVTPLVPGKSFVKMGLFSKIPSPGTEVYTEHRQEWEPQIPGTKQVEGAR